MSTQSPSTLVPTDIDLGNSIVYYKDSAITSFSSAKSETGWRKLGLLKEGAQLDVAKEMVEFYSGFPAVLQKQFVQSEDLRISGQILEINPRAVARILGLAPSSDATETVKASSPAPTTVASGSTASVVEVADATGYAVGDEIRVGNSGSYQYGRIRSINSNTITLYEVLSNNTAPTVGHAVAKVDETYFDFGATTVPNDISIKISHTLPGGYGACDLYILKAQMTGNTSILYPDNTQSQDGNGMPFELRAISDADVESGKTARWYWNQT